MHISRITADAFPAAAQHRVWLEALAGISLRVEAPDLCPRYLARVFTDVEVAPSPDWLRGRVEAAGLTGIPRINALCIAMPDIHAGRRNG